MFFNLITIVAFVVGAVLCGRAKRDHGKAATLGMIGCLLLVLSVLVRTPTIFAIDFQRDLGLSAASLGVIFAVVGLLETILLLAGFALLVAGVVARRGPRPQPPAPPQGYGYGQPAPPQGPGYGPQR
ncbi:hypothetical protein [Nonomuraea typhae]|uniref:hypothetical protein n=1 Tax=Nonomuraea typhae TaxID=2603600 RepID=UPI0012F7F516|nr:hypothetical protein [Nonomuraea typhae]